MLNQNKPYIIAEIGVNHEGSIQSAHRMLELAASTGVNAVKFQAYTPSRYASASDAQRLERVSNFALTESDFVQLSSKALELSIDFLCTPLTEDWVNVLNPYVRAFKIASGDIAFKPVIQKAAQSGKSLIVSTGTATLDEIDQAVQWVQDEVGSQYLKDRLVLMHCVSAYPTPIDQANILSIPFLKKRYGLSIGYSNHVIGIEASLAAVAVGAEIIEVHFTDCKESREFRDHALSFDQEDLKTFVAMAHNISLSLGAFDKNPQPCEIESTPLMRKGIIAARDLKRGEVLKREDLMFARPATEFAAQEIEKLIGKTLNEEIKKGFLLPRSAL